MKDIVIVITSGYRWNYFLWFILGLYELQEEGLLKLKFRLPLMSKILSVVDGDFVVKVVNRFKTWLENDDYNMSGYIEYTANNNRVKKYFTIDSADAPFLFDSKRLEECDVYFKMQCPINLENNGFYLTDEICIPWCDHSHEDQKLVNLTDRGKRKLCDVFEVNRHKIKPLMTGSLLFSTSHGFSYRRLKKAYEKNISNRKLDKNKLIMCYFGNAKGPKAETITKGVDYDWEGDIMGEFGDRINHPNEKRAIVSKFIESIENCDARVISKENSDADSKDGRDLVIPKEVYPAFVSDFQYNMNVSGYRRSIPSRFAESFMLNTAVITDKLGVRWYLPFEKEVVETVEMGYLPNNKVDWHQFEDDLHNLPCVDTKEIFNYYENKWAPRKVAKYILNTLLDE